ncbi:MAG: GIY-YIG nuclease family protein [Alphaproteobacteria bacterium]|nr:GIY-YIG nuclease family protein [Alphaproteobacteria bacterium]
MPGYLYVLQNPAFPHLFKVGSTDDHSTRDTNRKGRPRTRPRKKGTGHIVYDRARELYDGLPGVPSEYFVIFCVQHPDPQNFEEKIVHPALAHGRYNPDREFFDLPEEEIREIIARLLGEGPQPDEHTEGALKIWKQERNRFWSATREFRGGLSSDLKSNVQTTDRAFDDDDVDLDCEISIDQKISKLRAIVNAKGCHVYYHLRPDASGVVHVDFDLFSSAGICFSSVHMYLSASARFGYPLPHKRERYVHHHLGQMCDALAGKENEIFARLGARSI